MTSLQRILHDEIAATGPITVARFMALALGHPTAGYYTTRDPFGSHGDFITAPEISQMFGEVLGLWVASQWVAMGSPQAVTLIELGPGRGTLMADALRAMKVVPGFLNAATVRLVEISPTLIARQKQTLAGTPRLHWHDSLSGALSAAAETPVIVLANEFLDALPVHQLVLTERGWCERTIGLDPDHQLVWVLDHRPSPLAALIPPALSQGHHGALIEVSPAILTVVSDLARYCRAHGGAALFIDYGHDRSGYGDTLQALANHNFADPLAAPGDADLTVHVDFQTLVTAAANAGLATDGPITQRAFLTALGINTRAQRLKNAAPAQADTITAALTRLIDPQEMGNLFKVAALRSPHLPPSAGFTA